MNNPQVEMISIDLLKPYKNNPRNNEKAIDSVAKSISDFGFKVPIVVDSDYVIITGHTRYLASKQLGLKEVPVIIAKDLTEEQVRKYRIADNKVGQLADWDLTLLGEEMQELKEFNFEDYGFNEIEMMILTEDIEPEEFDKKEIEEYSKRADAENLKVKRLIIKYDNEQEKKELKALFNIENLKVIYKCEELMKMEN